MAAEPGGARLGVELHCCPLVPVVEVEEFGVALQGVVPALLEVCTIEYGIEFELVEVGDISHLGHIVVVELWLAILACPRLTYTHRVLGHCHRVLRWRYCRLLEFAVMLCNKLLGRHLLYTLVGKAVTEAPVALRADEALASPLVVAPPHITQGEELLNLVGVVLQTLLCVVGVVVVGIVGVSRGSLIVVWVGVFCPTATGVVARVAVVEQ